MTTILKTSPSSPSQYSQASPFLTLNLADGRLSLSTGSQTKGPAPWSRKAPMPDILCALLRDNECPEHDWAHLQLRFQVALPCT